MPRHELPPELQEYIKGNRNNLQLGIPDQEIWLESYRHLMRQDLNSQLKGRFYISSDLSTAEDVVLGPDGQASPFVPVNLPENLGPFNDMNLYALNTFADITTRSRFAQLGIDVRKKFTSQSRIWITNYAHRPIYLPQGTAICYFYYWDGKYLAGEELEEAIGTRIKLTGTEGTDWRPWYGKSSYNPSHELRGLEFFIDPRSRRYIPRTRKIDLDRQMMTLNDGPARNHSRNVVNRYLEKVPKRRDESHLVISETLSKLFLDESIHGICDSGLGLNERPVGAFETEEFQINSVLLRGGNTYGRFRTETWEGTGKRPPETVLVKFVNA